MQILLKNFRKSGGISWYDVCQTVERRASIMERIRTSSDETTGGMHMGKKLHFDKAAEKEAADFAIRRLKTAGYIRANISLKMY